MPALVGIDARLNGDVVVAEEPGDLEEVVVAVRRRLTPNAWKVQTALNREGATADVLSIEIEIVVADEAAGRWVWTYRGATWSYSR